MPLIANKAIPKEINHFCNGKTVFFGFSVLENKQFKERSADAFKFTANSIELKEKKSAPDKTIRDANSGHSVVFYKNDITGVSIKAMLDFALLNANRKELKLRDKTLKFAGITTDMLATNNSKKKTKEGK